MNHDEFVAYKRKETASISRAILEQRIDIIKGIRKICALRILIDNPEDDVFLPLRAVDSETDHFPIENQRASYATEYLKNIDRELEEYLAEVRDEIFVACREIIRHYM